MYNSTFDVIIDNIVERMVEWLSLTFDAQFTFFSDCLEFFLSAIQSVFLVPPFYVIIAILGALAWWSAGRRMCLFTILSLSLCVNLNLWHDTMVTMGLVLTATIGALLFAIPCGILAAQNKTLSQIIRPVMDFLQTMPPYVYLIPSIALLGFGASPAIAAIVIVAIPPALRLTVLGITQVPAERLEVGQAFGANRWQILIKIQLPTALPTIMAGVNQALMFALGMAVIAGIIGAGGLGKEVYRAINYLDIPMAFDAGLAIVFLAIILDRISQGTIELLKKGPKK